MLKKTALSLIAKHQILGATVLLQAEINLEGEYLMAVSLVWSKGLQRSAQSVMSGSGKPVKTVPGKYSLKDWIAKSINPTQVVGPRQYVDNDGVRHFIGFVSMPYDKAKRPVLERMLQVKGAMSVAWSLRSDVETSSVSETVLEQTSVGDVEESKAASELTERIRQRFRGAVPPVRPLFPGMCIVREHPLFPGSKMLIYACELSGEFSEYKYN